MPALVRHENVPVLPASDWSVVRIYPSALPPVAVAWPIILSLDYDWCGRRAYSFSSTAIGATPAGGPEGDLW
eukprot:3116253-Pyramimonas_sp.AAC.1